jgi:hypothetical protein
MKFRGIDATTYSDELPDVPEFPELPNVALHRIDSETSGVPVERWAHVVGEPAARACRADTLSELLGPGVNGFLRLRPQLVSILCERDRSVIAQRIPPWQW